jgi:hypothetical protein
LNGHYIEIRQTDRGADLPTAVIALLEPESVVGGWVSLRMLTLAGGTTVYLDEPEDDQALLAIGHRSPNAAGRRVAAGRVYDRLLPRQDWTLRWTSDDVPGVIALRPALIGGTVDFPGPARTTPDPPTRLRIVHVAG